MSRSTSPPRSAAPGLSGYVFLLGSVWVSAFLVSIDYTALNVALPTLATDFGVGTSEVSWIALAYMLVMVALTPVTGPLIQRLGYPRALGGALGLFALASSASALAPGFEFLVALRAAQGIAAAVMFVIGPAVIRTAIPVGAQDRAFAVFSTGPMAGLCAGPAIGGQLTALFGWQSVFLFNVPAALVAIVLLRASQGRASSPPASSHPASCAPKSCAPCRAVPMPDPISALAAVAGLLMMVLGLNQGEEWGWGSHEIVALFAGGVLAFGIVVARERRVGREERARRERRIAAPLVDPEILSSAGFRAAAAAFLPLLLVFGGSVFLLPFYFEWLRGLDTEVVGRVLMVQPAATILVSNLAAFRLAGIGRRALCLAGISLLVVGIALLAAAGRGAPLSVPVLALALMGAGAGLYYPVLVQVGLAGIPARLAASASSLQTAVRVLAQMLGVVVFETVFSQLYPAALDVARAAAASDPGLDRMQGAFDAVFWCGAVVAALALVPVLRLSENPGSPPDAGRDPAPGMGPDTEAAAARGTGERERTR